MKKLTLEEMDTAQSLAQDMSKMIGQLNELYEEYVYITGDSDYQIKQEIDTGYSNSLRDLIDSLKDRLDDEMANQVNNNVDMQ